MTKDRKQALVLAAKARAAITSYLGSNKGISTAGQILPEVAKLGYNPITLSNLLVRMADGGLIRKHEIDHPNFKYGYSNADDETPGGDVPARRQKRKGADVPIDIRANKDGSVTVRFNGLVFRVSKED